MRPTGEWLNRPGGLAERLAQMRKAAHLTGARMAADLGWQRTKVSKLENGRQMPSEEDLDAWARATGHADATLELRQLLAEAQSVHRQYRHQARRGHAAAQEDLDELTRQSARIRDFQGFSIPGLLQTREYARYRMAETVRFYGFGEEGMDAALTARMRRQEVLYEPGRTFEFIITEASVLFWLCPPGVLAGQIDRLQGSIAIPNVTLGIIPERTEVPLTPLNGFTVYDDTTAYIELHGGEDWLHGTEVAQYEKIFDALKAEAVTGDEARRLLLAAADRLTDEP